MTRKTIKDGVSQEAVRDYIQKGTGSEIPANTSLYDALTFKTAPIASLVQDDPVKDEWYTVLNRTGATNILFNQVLVMDTAETVQVKWTIDNIVVGVVTINAAIATAYYLYLGLDSLNMLLKSTTTVPIAPLNIQCKSIKIEVRKTTADGNGQLRSTCIYQTR